MANRVKMLIALMLVLGACSVKFAIAFPSHDWLRFAIYLAAVLMSSGLKVAMPKGEGTASVNFPFILLGIVQLSPGQAIALAALSVLAQCRIKVIKPFSLMQVAFNVANTVTATALAWFAFASTTILRLELAPALAVAATIYFLANTIPVAMVIGWSQNENPLRLWKREFPWYLPFYLVGAMLAALAQMVSVNIGWTTSLLLIPAIYTIYRAYQAQRASVRAREKHLEETEALHLRTIEGLAMAIEAKDHNTHDHLVRTRVYVSEIGAILGLDNLQMQALLTASFLHDIGKLAVPEHIINKPGKLTKDEFEKIKIHPVVGADILERVRFPYPVVPIVRSHHEAWDGSGYPDGLKGEEIPIGARILTVVDCFDALASDRPYRRAMPTAEAMELVKSKAGSQFDPTVVKILEERYIELEEKARQQGGELEPLNTEISVWRGEAPGAGFQQDNTSGAETARSDYGEDVKGALATVGTSCESLNLIAAANQEAQVLFEVSQTLGHALSANETVSMMSARLRRLAPFDCIALYLRGGDSLSIQYLDGEGARSFTTSRIPLGEGLSGWVAQHGKPILNGNPKVEPNYNTKCDDSERVNAALSLPLFDLSREIFGVLTVYSKTADGFSRDHLRMLQAVESKFSLALQNALRPRMEEKDGALDPLMQLPNAKLFFLSVEAELTRSRLAGSPLGVVVCGVNNLKQVTEHHGQHMGNLLLHQIAEGFRRCCGAADTVARLGADEFAFLLPEADAQTTAAQTELMERVARKACRDLNLPVELSSSTGTACFPGDGDTAEALLGLADRRMHLHRQLSFQAKGVPPQRPAMELAASA